MKPTTMNQSLITVGILTAVMGSTPLAMAQTKSANPPEQEKVSVAATSSTRSDARPVEDLQLAVQRLHDAIHAMSKAPAGAQRNQAIKDGNRALAEVHVAMANLPSDLRIAAASEGNYQKAIDRLQLAADKLRQSTQALATDAYSKRRNETIKDIDKALLETQQVMIDVPINAWGE